MGTRAEPRQKFLFFAPRTVWANLRDVREVLKYERLDAS
jgi:hypothetical protein